MGVLKEWEGSNQKCSIQLHLTQQVYSSIYPCCGLCILDPESSRTLVHGPMSFCKKSLTFPPLRCSFGSTAQSNWQLLALSSPVLLPSNLTGFQNHILETALIFSDSKLSGLYLGDRRHSTSLLLFPTMSGRLPPSFLIGKKGNQNLRWRKERHGSNRK
jgi:hypothetical protein